MSQRALTLALSQRERGKHLLSSDPEIVTECHSAPETKSLFSANRICEILRVFRPKVFLVSAIATRFLPWQRTKVFTLALVIEGEGR